MKSLAFFWIFVMSMALPLSGVSIRVQAQEAEHSDHEHEQTQKEKTHNDDHSEHEDHEEGHDDHQDHGEDEGAHDEAGEEAHEEHDEHGGHEEQGASIDPQTLRALGAEVSIASPGRVSQTVSLPGEVRLNKEAVAQITPRYSAQIVDVSARIGDSVAAGDTLAIGESSQTLQRFSLKSLIRGTVIDRSVTLGEHIQPSDAAFVVADLSTLWVDIALYPRQIGLVKKGQPVRISTTFGPEPVNTQIDYLDPIVSEQLRSGLARIYLDNAAGQWRPGMFIEAEVTLTETEAEVVVPQTAVIKYQGRQVVFVKEGDSWRPRPVVLGARDRDQVVIRSGVSPGEQYVAKGGFTLKADLLKSEFESGHNH